MSEKGTKALRKEVRESVRELLPEHLSKAHEDAVLKVVEKRLDLLEKSIRAQVTDTLQKLEKEHKDTMGYLVRSLTTGALKPQQ